jgi:UDP-N-acetylmuramate dehydrogenase
VSSQAVGGLVRRLGPRARLDQPLGPLTTYRVGGRAAVLVELESEAEFPALAGAVVEAGLEVVVVGKGSNLLVSDAGFPGVVVTLGESFSWVDTDPAGPAATAGAATTLPVLARRTAAAGLAGLEWAVGVPGSVGGGIRMNAGGHGSDIEHSLLSARIADLLSGGVREVKRAELGYGYRRSDVGPHHLVLSGRFELRRGERQASDRVISEIVRWRRDNQPGGQNAGSVFTNPPGDSAGRLIDSCGLKGFRIGSAQVSDKHANFIQADPGGSADDVRRVMESVRETVSRETGVMLQTEVRLVGFGGWLE